MPRYRKGNDHPNGTSKNESTSGACRVSSAVDREEPCGPDGVDSDSKAGSALGGIVEATCQTVDKVNS